MVSFSNNDKNLFVWPSESLTCCEKMLNMWSERPVVASQGSVTTAAHLTLQIYTAALGS